MPADHHPHRVLKYCPSCGNNTFKPHTEKSLKCETCGFCLFMNAAAAVVAILFNDEGKLLFTVRKHEPARGMLDLPGGFVDPGETAEQALSREVKEELNLTLDDVTYFGSFKNEYLYGGITYSTLDLAFICFAENFDNLLAADDVESFAFTDLKEVNFERISFESIKQIVEELKRGFHR
jgi:NAD+ diphosphatase